MEYLVKTILYRQGIQKGMALILHQLQKGTLLLGEALEALPEELLEEGLPLLALLSTKFSGLMNVLMLTFLQHLTMLLPMELI
jgi:hypothetical protein